MMNPSPLRTALGILCLSYLIGCIDGGHDDNNGQSGPVYSATVVRTEYGIPHINASDWGSLGYGYGHVYAEENFCVLMAEVLRAMVIRRFILVTKAA